MIKCTIATELPGPDNIFANLLKAGSRYDFVHKLSLIFVNLDGFVVIFVCLRLQKLGFPSVQILWRSAAKLPPPLATLVNYFS